MRVLIAASGTGGHIIPALSVARVLKKREPTATFMTLSSEHSVGRKLWDHSVGDWKTLPIQSWPKGDQWLSPTYWAKQGQTAVTTRKILKEFQPQVVVGFGGSASGPAVAFARWMKIPTAIHEQNVFPGRSTRWLSRLANRVAVTFEETKRHLPRKTIIKVTGIPIRPGLGLPSRKQALQKLKLSPDLPVLLVTGGSQGSRRINRVVIETLELLKPAQRKLFQVLHLAGSRDTLWVKEMHEELKIQGQVHPVLDRMDLAYAAATLSVTRAGAATLGELIATTTPAVLVPYRYADGHQVVNAQWLASRGGALNLDETAMSPDRFLETVLPLMGDAHRLDVMKKNLKKLQTSNAAESLADLIQEIAAR